MNVMKLEAGTFVKGLGVVDVPKYINYNDYLSAWVITRLPHITAKRWVFPDRDYASCGHALKAAIKELERNGSELRSRRRLNSVERCDKSFPTDHVGVMYRIYRPKKLDYDIHYFRVHNPLTHKNTSIYIGSDNTYLRNWDTAFDTAVKLRDQYEREYNIDCYWKGLNVRPESAVA